MSVSKARFSPLFWMLSAVMALCMPNLAKADYDEVSM